MTTKMRVHEVKKITKTDLRFWREFYNEAKRQFENGESSNCLGELNLKRKDFILAEASLYINDVETSDGEWYNKYYTNWERNLCLRNRDN